jgi:MFS transporter, ACDE family, multidrug resistance protein
VVGRSPRGPVDRDGSFAAALTHAAACTVVLVEPGTTPRQLTAASLHELRSTSV